MFIIGTGKTFASGAAEIAKERKLFRRGRRMRVGQRNSEQRVRTEPILVRRAVELDQFLVEASLIGRIKALQSAGDCFVHIAHCFGYALARITFLIAIAQFPRFVLAGAGAARHRGAAKCAAIQMDIYFDCWVAARIENLARR